MEFVEGDAQAMPFADASFDAVVSVVGVMFAADQEAAAAEMLRVCAPGGTIALANWTPEGFIGGLFRTIGAHLPPPPPGLAPPPLWGTEDRLRELLGPGVREMSTRRRDYTFRFDAPRHFTDFFRENYGPMVTAFAALAPPGGSRWRPGSTTSCAASTGSEGTARWRSRPSTWKSSRSGPEPWPDQPAGGRRPVRSSVERSHTGSSRPPARRRSAPVPSSVPTRARVRPAAPKRAARASGSPASRKP